VGDAWVRMDLLKSHTYVIAAIAMLPELDAHESNPKG
jgi:hypothetical protein